jgi:hypothetical protein
MGREQKKQAKQKDRERKKAADKHRAELFERNRRHRDQYPQVLIDPTNGDPEFVKLVQEAHSGMDFDDSTMFTSGDREFYRRLRRYGFTQANSWLKETMLNQVAIGDDFGQIGGVITLIKYGHHLLERIPEEARRRLMPYNDVHVDLGQKMILQFSSMLSKRGAAGTIFYGRRKPTIELDGKRWIVAFSRHAIERICERLNPRYIHYGASGDVHAFFSKCVYFEPIILHGNQPAFVLYDLCHDPQFAHYRTYVKDILGEQNVVPSNGTLYYKVGYCPIVFEDDFVKAKTFLYPGYTGTPEFGLILRGRHSPMERELLIRNATTQDGDKVVVNDNPETIKWFHDNGVPQVVQMKQPVFLYS